MRAFKEIYRRTPKIREWASEARNGMISAAPPPNPTIYIITPGYLAVNQHLQHNQIMASSSCKSSSSGHLSILFLLLLATAASLCALTVTAAGTDDGGSSAATDSGRRARAAATVADLLSVHNAARQAVGVAPLSWSAQIAGYAKAYARSRRGDCAPRRSPLFYFGENLVVEIGRAHV